MGRCKFVHKLNAVMPIFGIYLSFRQHSHGFGMAVYRVHQRADMLRRGELTDAVAQVKDVGRAGGRGVGVRHAEAVQHPVYLGGNVLRRGKQNVRVDIAL